MPNFIAELTEYAEPLDNENGLYFSLIRELLCLADEREQLDALDYSSYIAEFFPPSFIELYPNMADMIPDPIHYDWIHTKLIEALDDEYNDDEVSHLCMTLSLCPVHFTDWHACFIDEPDDCAQIRRCFPHSHDT